MSNTFKILLFLISSFIYNVMSGQNISILTYNVFMRPQALFRNDQENRSEKICNKILSENFDIILFQECFESKSINIFIDKLNVIYPYIILPNKTTFFNSGLMILSKYPVMDIMYYNFTNLCGADKLASKGYTKFNIMVDSLITSVMTLHQQAGNTKKRSLIRKSNLDIISKNGADIIGGDFNTEGIEVAGITNHFKEYNVIDNLITYGPNKTLDYIISKWSISKYKVLDWNLSDHFPVCCNVNLHISPNLAMKK